MNNNKNFISDKKNEIKTQFLTNPNFKFEQIITINNNNSGYNDIFEIYQSLRDEEIYLASPNKKEYYLDIICIKNCKLFTSLKGHNNFINIVKYFINNNEFEYLISADKNSIIIVWDINNNYSNIYQIKGNYSRGGYISSILHSFINLNNYIIFSYNSKQYTNIYSFDKKEKLKVLEKTNKYNTYYILLWLNKKDSQNYIIELSDGNIYIYNILENTLHSTINSGPFNYSKIISGIIYEKKNNDYLMTCNVTGNINIFDLDNNNIVYNLFLNKYNDNNKNKIYLSYILQWSKKYIIICEYYNKGLKIFDIDDFKIITNMKEKNFGPIISAKKFIHPIYGESLLTASQDNNIILWKI